MNVPSINSLCDRVRETAHAIHRHHRLRKQGHSVKQQHPIQVLAEDGAPLGDYCADLLINFGSCKFQIKKYVFGQKHGEMPGVSGVAALSLSALLAFFRG